MSEISQYKVLVFSKTSGYRHDSIAAGISAIESLAISKKAFTVEKSEDAELSMTSEALGRYRVVVLLHCSGDFLNSEQLSAVQQFVRGGGGIVGIHGAASGLKKDDWYGNLIGAHFDSHPDPEHGRVLVENADHYILKQSASREKWLDEWYNFQSHPRENTNLRVLLRGDTTSFKGGKMGEDHPLSWYQEFEGGRAWYTALGHFAEAYSDAWFLDQIYRAILWAGRGEGIGSATTA